MGDQEFLNQHKEEKKPKHFLSEIVILWLCK